MLTISAICGYRPSRLPTAFASRRSSYCGPAALFPEVALRPRPGREAALPPPVTRTPARRPSVEIPLGRDARHMQFRCPSAGSIRRGTSPMSTRGRGRRKSRSPTDGQDVREEPAYELVGAGHSFNPISAFRPHPQHCHRAPPTLA